MIRPGEPMFDTNGMPIQAHGGGILYANGQYYWYGEDKSGKTTDHRVDVVGIHAYASRNLTDWLDLGVILPAVPDDPSHDLHPSHVCERPKALYCTHTRQYVLWMHIDDRTYHKASVGVAVASQPEGPFHYVRSFRPLGVDSRDMTLFQDEDGAAYLFFSSDWNRTLRIARLSKDYLSLDGACTRAFVDQTREAPAVFKRGGKYYMLTSGCTGWLPNPTLYAMADHPMGQWRLIDNPCEDAERETTYRSQSTYVLPIETPSGSRYLYMGDRWNPQDLSDSRYVWLPIQWVEDRLLLPWRNAWDMGAFLRGENA